MTVDYERYARERPIFWGDVEYPQIYIEAIAGRSGNYVDIGAGDGGQIRSALDRGLLRDFTRIVAVDISAERISRAKALLPEIQAVVADAQSLPFPDASVDFVYSSQVIEHVPDDSVMAREIARVLVPGGAAVIGSALRLRGAWYFYRNEGRWVLDPTHVREYASCDEYARVFSGSGLTIEALAIEPIRYPITDLAIRAFLAARVMKPSDAGSIYKRHPSLSRLRSIRLAVPRYRHVFAHCVKPS